MREHRRGFLSRWRPETRLELDEYLQWQLDIKIPDQHVCLEPDHCSPMDFVSAAWCDGSDAVVWANRSGSKSFSAGVLTWLWSVHDAPCDTTILGGSKDQSKKAYKAANYCWDRSEAHQLVDGEPLMIETRLRNGSAYEILTQSQKSARGPHPQKTILDEIDEFDPEIHEAALSQPQSRGDVVAQLIQMSTMHRGFGVMNDQVANAAARGIPLFKWCVWEVAEPCHDYSCSTCRLTEASCPGKERMLTATGFYRIDDIIQKYTLLSYDAWQSEWLCRRPRRKGLVYEECADWVRPNAVERCAHIIPDMIPPDSWEHYRGLDAGFEAPTACLWMARNPETDEIVIWDEYFVSGRTYHDHAQILKDHPNNRGRSFIASYSDPSAADLNEELSRVGIVTSDPPLKDVDSGLERVRRRLKINPATGRPRLLVCERCTNVRREWSAYHYRKQIEGKNPSEQPEKKDDHTCDGGRYCIVGVDEGADLYAEHYRVY